MENFNEYQDFVNKVADGYELSDLFRNSLELRQISEELAYNSLGLAGEAGESAEKIKKIWRDNGLKEVWPVIMSDEEKRKGLAYELGDVLYYLARIANLTGYKLSDIASLHIEKLQGRIERGTVKGEGDHR